MVVFVLWPFDQVHLRDEVCQMVIRSLDELSQTSEYKDLGMSGCPG